MRSLFTILVSVYIISFSFFNLPLEDLSSSEPNYAKKKKKKNSENSIFFFFSVESLFILGGPMVAHSPSGNYSKKHKKIKQVEAEISF